MANKPFNVGNTPAAGGTAQTSQHQGLPSISHEGPIEDRTQTALNLLDSNWGKIVSGSNTINKKEGKWLQELAKSTDNDPGVLNAIKTKADGANVSNAANNAGIGIWLESISAPQAEPQIPDAVDAPTPDPTIVTGGEQGSSATPTPDSSPLLGVQLPEAPVIPSRVWATKEPANFPGPWKIQAGALTGKYNGVSAEKFGTTDVQLPTGGTMNVRDMHYRLADGSVGMHLIPVSDNSTIQGPDGPVAGHKPMDDFIRKESGLEEGQPIYALIAYVHPEAHSGEMSELGGTMLKTEMGNTHLGGYLGKGVTTNSPFTYHDREWHVSGYPANVQIVSLHSVDQATLNKNGILVDRLLNEDVQFPSDYKNDKFRLIDLNSNLMFYRDKLKAESKDPERSGAADIGYITDSSHELNASYKMYCAEHKTAVVNTMLNLPHNPEAFNQMFGAEEGPALWQDFKDSYATLHGKEFIDKPALEGGDQTDFEPLWVKEGLDIADVRPLTVDQHTAYHDARATGKLDSFEGPRPLEPGVGMAWAPETTADLVNDFLEVYASFVDVGAVVSSSVLMGFGGTAQERLGLEPDDYAQMAVPVMSKMLLQEAKVEAANNPMWAKQTAGALYVAVGGKQEDFAPGGTVNPQLMGLVDAAMGPVKAALPQISMAEPISRDAAYAELKEMIQPDLKAARETAATDASKTVFYSPPAVTHRVAMGIHESSKYVNIDTICTAVDHSELKHEDAA